MRMIKNNFHVVVKLWLNQFAMMFLGILLLLPAAGMKADWPMLAASLFTVLFYLALIFWVCCEVGLHDSVAIDSGRMKKNRFKCTVLALVANLPSLLATVVACVSKCFIPGVGFFASAKGATGAAANVYAVSTGINEVLHVMYRGIMLFFDLDVVPFLYLPIVILSLAACHFGYNAGTEGFLASLLRKKHED